jgi:hypothetical protein
MSRKRKGIHLEPPSSKKSRNGTFLIPGKVYTARPRYTPHQDSRVGDNFHSVPYPLTLLPFKSWCVFHRRKEGTPNHQLLCPQCENCRGKPTAHQRKLFLVAERLSWEEGVVPTRERTRNEEALWEVNFELGIVDPHVDDTQNNPGGKNSRINMFYPYDTEEEAEMAFDFLQRADQISQTSFKLWTNTLDKLSHLAATEAPKESSRAPLQEVSHSRANVRAALPTPSSSNNDDDFHKGHPHPKSPEAILQKHGQFLQNIPFPVGFILAQRASRNSECRELLDSVANHSASHHSHDLFKKILDECYKDCISSLPQSGGPKDMAVLALLSQKALEHLDLARLLGRVQDARASPGEMKLFNWLYQAASKSMHCPGGALKALDPHLQTVQADLAHLLSTRCSELARIELTPDGEARIVHLREGMNLSWQDIACSLGNIRCTPGSLLIYYAQILQPAARHKIRCMQLHHDLLQACANSTVPGLSEMAQSCSPAIDLASGLRQQVKRAIEKHAQQVPIFGRLFDRISSGKSTAKQQFLFRQVVEAFKTFDRAVAIDPGTYNEKRCERILLLQLQGFYHRIMQQLLQDDTCFAHSNPPPPIWTCTISKVVSEHDASKTMNSSRGNNGNAITLHKTATPLASWSQVSTAPPAQPARLLTAKNSSLPDFYCLLDKIERTSYVGMRFLETYAEYLRKDVCTDCWLKGSLMDDDEFEALEREIEREMDDDGVGG